MATLDTSGLAGLVAEFWANPGGEYLPVPYALLRLLNDYENSETGLLPDGGEYSPLELLDIVRETLAAYCWHEYPSLPQPTQ